MTKTPLRPSADPTRKAILKSARKLFVKQGFAGTSISEIAKLAKINQSLIYHHFENKQGLWKAVKKDVLEAFQNLQDLNLEKNLECDNAKEFITNLVQFRFQLYDRYPDIRRMVDWQYLEASTYELKGIGGDPLAKLADKIKAFQQRKQMITIYDPDLVLTLIFQASIGYFKAYKNLETNKSKEEIKALKKQHIDLCCQVLVNGLTL